LVGGTIGKHLRHTLDHFAAITPALESQTICYDNRTRDVPMETEPGAGLAEIHRLREVLGAISVTRLAGAVNVRILCSADGEEAEVASTLGRELAFATHHAIHHQAMMKAIAIEHGLTFGGDAQSVSHANSGSGSGPGFGGTSGPAVCATFGVAPSTAQHAASVDEHHTLRQPTVLKCPAFFPTSRPGQA